jgi:hypothetical protein
MTTFHWPMILRALAKVSSSGIPCTLPLSKSAIRRPISSLQALSTKGSTFAVFGAQYSVDKVCDSVLRPIASFFDDLIRAQLHFVSLHLCSLTRNISSCCRQFARKMMWVPLGVTSESLGVILLLNDHL